jgi:hypothetical protein
VVAPAQAGSLVLKPWAGDKCTCSTTV